MKFGITLEIDTEAEQKSNLIYAMSEALETYLNSKVYGTDILNYFIGFICIKTKLGYEDWYKIRRPKYKEIEKIKSTKGTLIEIKGVFSHDIKIDNEEYDKFISVSDKESRKILESKILTSIAELKLPKKVKDFDKERFRQDLEDYFKEQELA